ncbi:hypothetical protein ABBQ32_006343 [Trebouxia sp. C0010 RCD-2024]
MLSSKLKDTCTWLHSANKSVACAAVSSRSIKQELALPAAGHYYRMACSLLHFTKGRTARDRLTESRQGYTCTCSLLCSYLPPLCTRVQWQSLCGYS